MKADVIVGALLGGRIGWDVQHVTHEHEHALDQQAIVLVTMLPVLATQQ